MKNAAEVCSFLSQTDFCSITDLLTDTLKRAFENTALIWRPLTPWTLCSLFSIYCRFPWLADMSSSLVIVFVRAGADREVVRGADGDPDGLVERGQSCRQPRDINSGIEK